MVLVTHDRFMLDRLATEIVGLDGAGGHALVTDYEQYRAWARETERNDAATRRRGEAAKGGELAGGERMKIGEGGGATKPRRKLTFAEQKEYDGMEGRILAAEAEVQRWHAAMEDPAVMANHQKLAEVCAKMHEGAGGGGGIV